MVFLTVECRVTAGSVADYADNLIVPSPRVSVHEATAAVPLAAVPDLTEAADGAAPDLDLVQVPLVDVVTLLPVDNLHVLQLVQDVRLAPGVHCPQAITRVSDDPLHGSSREYSLFKVLFWLEIVLAALK